MAEAGHALIRSRSRSRSLRNLLSAETGVEDEQKTEKIPREDDSRKKEMGTPAARENVTANFAFLSILVAVTILTMPYPLQTQHPSGWHVWYYGWISAISTGLGAIPFYFWSQPSGRWLGVSNAVAGGMMVSASYSLVSEGLDLENDALVLFGYTISQMLRTSVGVVGGMIFVALCQKYLEDHDNLAFGTVHGLQAAKILLMVGVMTLHSFAEGLGIGASFCGPDGTRLGVLISATLAVHNVPEGLAVALVLIPRGVSPLRTTLACVATSLPQPLVAAPAFLFLESCSSFRAAGLGFAAGAMVWVAAFELIPDAITELPRRAVAGVSAAAFAGMQLVGVWLDAETRPA